MSSRFITKKREPFPSQRTKTVRIIKLKNQSPKEIPRSFAVVT